MSTNAPAPSFSPKLVVGALAAVAIVGSAFLNWADFTGTGGTATLKGTDVPVQFLVDKGTTSTSPSLLLLLGIAAALIAIGLVVPNAQRLSAFVGGALAIVAAVLYCVQVQRGLDDDISSLKDIDLFDFISIGVYVALAGGIVGLVSALMPGTGVAASTASPAPPPPAA